METKQIKIIVKKPYQEAYVDEIENSFDKFRNLVGCSTVEFCSFPLDRGIQMLIDEDGKMRMLAGNFMVPEFRDCIVGTCIFASYDKDGEVIGLTEKQIQKVNKYLKDFALHNGEDIYTQCDQLLDKSIRKMHKNKEEDLC
jgi:hypothetical protein